MEPVDSARVEEAAPGLTGQGAGARGGRPRAPGGGEERAWRGDAQLKRRSPSGTLLKKQYASKDKLAEIDQEVAASQDRVHASDLKSQYLQLMIIVAERSGSWPKRRAHGAGADRAGQAQAMRAGNVPEAASVNAGDIDQRVGGSAGAEASIRREIAQRRSNAVDVYNRWQQATRAPELSPARRRCRFRPTGEPTRTDSSVAPEPLRWPGYILRLSPVRTQRK